MESDYGDVKNLRRIRDLRLGQGIIIDEAVPAVDSLPLTEPLRPADKGKAGDSEPAPPKDEKKP
jgi:hypothetical protein